MRRVNCVALCLGLAVMGMATGPAVGELITFEFAGEITGVFDLRDRLGGAVTVGTPFSGFYTFESTTPDESPDLPTSGYYIDVITALGGQVGELDFEGPVGTNNSTFVMNDVIQGGLDAYDAGAGVDFLGEPLSFGISFRDDTGAVFSDDSLPVSPEPFQLVDRIGFRIVAGSEDFSVYGEIKSIVPEPTTLALLGLGTLGMIRRRV